MNENRSLLMSLSILNPLLLLTAALATHSLTACERHVTDANLKAVNPEMTTKEVESILGQPTRVDVGPELTSTDVKTLPVTRYVYEQGGKKVILTFVGDKLSSGGVEGSFGK